MVAPLFVGTQPMSGTSTSSSASFNGGGHHPHGNPALRASHSPLWIPPPVPGAPPMLVDTSQRHHHSHAAFASSHPPAVPFGASAAAFGGGMTGLERPQWFEMRAVTESHINHIVPVTAVLADPSEELIWSGLENVRLGMIFLSFSDYLFSFILYIFQKKKCIGTFSDFFPFFIDEVKIVN